MALRRKAELERRAVPTGVLAPPPDVGVIGRALLPAVDRVVDARYPSAAAAVERLRAQRPVADATDLADDLIRLARRELVTVGAVAGGTAAVPGIGTSMGLAANTADVGWTVTRIGELVLAIGLSYGHTPDSIEERRAWVLAVLAMATGASNGLRGLAREVGSKGGARIIDALPNTVLIRMNRALGRHLVTRWGARQGLMRLGRLLPFGVGAVIGGAGNAAIVSVVGREAKRFFDVS